MFKNRDHQEVIVIIDIYLSLFRMLVCARKKDIENESISDKVDMSISIMERYICDSEEFNLNDDDRNDVLVDDYIINAEKVMRVWQENARNFPPTKM